MRIDVLDADTLARVGWVDVWVSLYWDSPYYSEGSFTLEVRPTAENLQLLQEGRWLVRSDESPRIPMRICSRANQNEDANLVVSGYPATWLLTKRVSAVSIKNQNAEAAMRSLVSAAKPWPRLALGTEYGFDTTFEKQTSGGSIFDYCKTIGQACDLGFRIVLDGKGSKKKLLFECFRPTFDPNRRYSPRWGNLLNAGWSFADTDYANIALVQGAGEGDERATVWVGDVNATGSDRREMYVDARDVQPEDGETSTSQSYLAKLADRGGEKLLAQLRTGSIEFDVDDDTLQVGDVLSASLPQLGYERTHLQRTHHLRRYHCPHRLPAAGPDQSGAVCTGQARAAHREPDRGAAGHRRYHHRGRAGRVVEEQQLHPCSPSGRPDLRQAEGTGEVSRPAQNSHT